MKKICFSKKQLYAFFAYQNRQRESRHYVLHFPFEFEVLLVELNAALYNVMYYIVLFLQPMIKLSSKFPPNVLKCLHTEQRLNQRPALEMATGCTTATT